MNDNPWGTRFGQYINSFWPTYVTVCARLICGKYTATDSRQGPVTRHSASPRFGVDWGDHTIRVCVWGCPGGSGDPAHNSPKSVLEGGEKYIYTDITLQCLALQTYIHLTRNSTRRNVYQECMTKKHGELCAKKKKGPTVHGPIVLLKWNCSGGIRPNGFWQMLSEIDPVIGFQADLWDRGRNNFIFPSLSIPFQYWATTYFSSLETLLKAGVGSGHLGQKSAASFGSIRSTFFSPQRWATGCRNLRGLMGSHKGRRPW